MVRPGVRGTSSYRQRHGDLDKTALRVHRRSIEWKTLRQDEVNRRRNISVVEMTPLKEVDQNRTVKKKASKCEEDKKSAAKEPESRAEKLRRWKEERELKRKLEAKEKAQNKPSFKFTHVTYPLKPFGASTSVKTTTVQGTAKPGAPVKTTKPQHQAAGPSVPAKGKATSKPASKTMTKRNPVTKTAHCPPSKVQTRHNSQSKVEKRAAQPVQRMTRSNPTVQRKAAPPQSSTAAKPGAKAAKPQAKAAKPQAKVAAKKTGRSTTEKEKVSQSFAPANFEFSAPATLTGSVKFKPLSPGSVANFFCPPSWEALSVASPITKRRCSTPKMPDPSKKTIPSPGASVIQEESSDGSSPSGSQSTVNVEKAITGEVKTAASEQKDFPAEPNMLAAASLSHSPLSDDKGSGENVTETHSSTPPYNNQNSATASSTSNIAAPDSTTPGEEPQLANMLLKRIEFRTPASVPGKARRKVPRNNRSSLVLRTLSPEEGVEVLMHSPMIEIRRRKKTPKAATPGVGDELNQPLPLNFDDLDDLCTSSTDSAPHSSSDEGPAHPVEPMCVTRELDPVEEEPDCQPHDVPYFRRLLQSQTDRLNALCAKWQATGDTEVIPEEELGQIRTTIGQARLLMDQRFKQFLGLIDNCEFNTGEKAILCSDLQGFWDMVYCQVEDVDAKFDAISKLQANNWKTEAPQVQKKKVTKKVVAKPSGPKKVVKSKFAMFRAQMKKQQQEQKPEETKTFEAGFFAVSSPVRSAKPHCEGGTPNKPGLSSKSNTPNRSGPSSKNNTPTASPMLKSVLERSACKSLTASNVPSPLAAPACTKQMPDSTSGMPQSTRSTTRRRSARLSSRRSLASEQFVATMLVNTPGRREEVALENKSLFTPEEGAEVDMTMSQRKRKRRSTRKSVSFSVQESSTVSPATSHIPRSSRKSVDVFAKFLAPSSSDSSEAMEVETAFDTIEEVEMPAQMKRSLQEEFDQQSSASKRRSRHQSAPGHRRRSSNVSPRSSVLKKHSASAQRRSRRSVHFESNTPPSELQTSMKLPVTPFNRNSLVPRSRRNSSRSRNNSETKPVGRPLVDNSDSDSPSTQFAKLRVNFTPGQKAGKETSLVVTPPPHMDTVANAQQTPDSFISEPTINLMSFSPMITSGPSSHKNTTNSVSRRRSRRSAASTLTPVNRTRQNSVNLNVSLL